MYYQSGNGICSESISGGAVLGVHEFPFTFFSFQGKFLKFLGREGGFRCGKALCIRARAEECTYL